MTTPTKHTVPPECEAVGRELCAAGDEAPAAVQAHLEVCSACRALWSDHQRLRCVLRERVSVAAPAALFVAAPPRPRAVRWIGALAASALGLALVLAVWPREPAPQTLPTKRAAAPARAAAEDGEFDLLGLLTRAEKVWSSDEEDEIAERDNPAALLLSSDDDDGQP